VRPEPFFPPQAPGQHVQHRGSLGVVQADQGEPDAVQFGQGCGHRREAVAYLRGVRFPALVVSQQAQPGFRQVTGWRRRDLVPFDAQAGA
jgi:hypothetical protein